MASSAEQISAESIWELAARQHGVVTREQLLELGLSERGIQHRLTTRRLHPIRHRKRLWRGVYALGRPELTHPGILMAATLFAGPEAVVSHETAAGCWRLRPQSDLVVEVTLPSAGRHPSGLRVHRRAPLPEQDRAVVDGVPVTSPIRTLIDLSTRLTRSALERAINEADRLELVDPERLHEAVKTRPGMHGVGPLRALLDRRAFVLTDSDLERRFLPLVRRAGLARPRTRARVNGFKVDFYWPELGLVVETDGLRYHRTPAQQARDRRRDQVHTAAGLTPLRFTHADVAFEPHHVITTLTAVSRRLTS